MSYAFYYNIPVLGNWCVYMFEKRGQAREKTRKVHSSFRGCALKERKLEKKQGRLTPPTETLLNFSCLGIFSPLFTRSIALSITPLIISMLMTVEKWQIQTLSLK